MYPQHNMDRIVAEANGALDTFARTRIKEFNLMRVCVYIRDHNMSYGAFMYYGQYIYTSYGFPIMSYVVYVA